MSIPTLPKRYIPRPFAENGNYQSVIPDTDAGSGRASFSTGFPQETQLPLANGGIAPNRLDFNGMFNLLSAIGFWQQSGGHWVYTRDLNYTVPCSVFHNGQLWWCLKENGPDSANGLVEPGTDEDYWIEFLRSLAEMGGGSAIGNPVGTVITYYGTQAPEGYLACDGTTFSATAYPQLYAVLGTSIVPDMRGYFVRGYDPANLRDPNGSARAIGAVQHDAIRNITATITSQFYNGQSIWGKASYTGGSFYTTGSSRNWSNGNNGINGEAGTQFLHFDSSRVVPTSTENRPVNISLLYCIKHD